MIVSAAKIANVFFLLIGSLGVSFAHKLEGLSFNPPFNEVDSGGSRMVPNWKSSGATLVSNNFVRLTPDRQSKKGALWSRKPLGVTSFSAIMKFRISGQAKTFFGDGIAVWITHHSYYTEGDLHGSLEKFVGIGIIFDTFKNTESLAAHRDVTILVNDGEKTWEMMTEEVQGCNMNVRYHNERADFSALDASRAQFIVSDTGLKVMVDAKNTGEWMQCATLDKLGLPPGWIKDAYIGITASTGQLADNHDVIALETDSEQTQDTTVAVSHIGNGPLEFNPAIASTEMDKRIVDAVNKLAVKVEEMNLHAEHEFAAVREKIGNLISKLEKREDNSEKRIENLESVIKTEVEGTLAGRLDHLEKQMKGSLDNKVNALSKQLDGKISRMEELVKKADAKLAEEKPRASSMPYYFVIIIVIAQIGWSVYLYRKLQKMHLL